jgi:predicted AAA+ superfamily ATPase
MHPLSVGEIVRPHVPKTEIDAPKAISDEDLKALWEHGGYPEPFIKRDRRFTNQWRQLRRQQFVREDVRELTRVQEVGQIEVLVDILLERSGSQIVYSNLAQEVSVSVDTIRRWVAILCSLHVGFLVRPWFKNVSKALRKEPKWFAFDWTSLEDKGARAETFIACHLLKATHAWQDLGFGTFELRYLRDKEKREVDFLVIRNKRPWFLVEAKNGDRTLSSALGHFQRQTGAEHAFQAVVDLEHAAVSCFSRTEPCVVPARTLLSQLP